MNCGTKLRRSALRVVGARGHRRIAQDALGDLLLCRHGGVSILSCRPWLRIVRRIWRRVGLLMGSWGTNAALGRSRKACALLVNGRRRRERRVSLEDVGRPGAVLGS